MNKVVNIIAILTGVAMAIFGANKFFNFIPMPELTPEQMEIFGAFSTIKWLMPLIGAGEFLGGLALANPKTRALGAIMLFPITLGILLHALTIDMSALVMALVFFLVNLWMIWIYRERYMPMIS